MVTTCRIRVRPHSLPWRRGLTTQPPDLPHDFRLHLYDHCPFCTRVELVLGWRGIRYDRSVYGYSDVAGPSALLGQKMLPVIAWSDAADKPHLLQESRDIIEALEAMGEPRDRIIHM